MSLDAVSDTATLAPETWAAALLAVDPALGGICLRARAGASREAWVSAALRATGRPARRVPPGIGDGRLFGELDLAATLAAGRPVTARGLLAEIGDGTLVIPMAERMEPGLAGRLAQGWDGGGRFAVLALDESDPGEPGPPPALMDRLAFHLSPEPMPLRRAPVPLAGLSSDDIAQARVALPRTALPDEMIAALAQTAAALGIHSLRALQLAARAARAAAALTGAARVDAPACEIAAALVLAPRARQLPPQEQDESAEPPPDTPPDPPEDGAEDRRSQTDAPPEDLVLEAAAAAIPSDLLAQLAAAAAPRRSGAGAGAGADQKGATRGRPAGSRRGSLGGQARLDLIATLRAAAPWQPMRRKMQPDAAPGRVLVSLDDFRIRRFRQKTEKVVIFVVDASGSAAMTRLAEAKGAVELLLAQAYARRDQVALVAFRGDGAETLLPPTRSLVQAKRRLAGLPGGGGTPLAAGLLAAGEMAAQARRQGLSPLVACLTDGRGNIALDGAPGREAALADARTVAARLRGDGVPALLIDTATRPGPLAADIAAAMGARYLALPRADAARLSAAIGAARDDLAG